MCPSRFLPVSIGVFLLVMSTAVAARAQTEAEIAYAEAKTAFQVKIFPVIFAFSICSTALN